MAGAVQPSPSRDASRRVDVGVVVVAVRSTFALQGYLHALVLLNCTLSQRCCRAFLFVQNPGVPLRVSFLQ